MGGFILSQGEKTKISNFVIFFFFAGEANYDRKETAGPDNVSLHSFKQGCLGNFHSYTISVDVS